VGRELCYDLPATTSVPARADLSIGTFCAVLPRRSVDNPRIKTIASNAKNARDKNKNAHDKKTGGCANWTGETDDDTCMDPLNKDALFMLAGSFSAMGTDAAQSARADGSSHNITVAPGSSIIRPSSIVQGDCLKVLARIPDDAIDLTVCSPPYDTLRSYHGDWSLDLPALGQALYRVTRIGGAAIVVIGDGTKNFAKSLTTARLTLDWCDTVGWRLFEQCLYHRDGNPGAWWSKRFRVDHKSILIFFKGNRPKTFDKTSLMVPSKHAGKSFAGTDRQTNGSLKPITPKIVNPAKCRGTVWHYAASNTEGNRIKKQHPATFPDKLALDLIHCFSQEGDVVLDPFAGSGTTCVMAALAGRQFIGIDVSDQYCEIARQRLRTEASIEMGASV